ncbi:MAG: hypothetical protein SNI58_09330 [Rikenellaceae bacterium]
MGYNGNNRKLRGSMFSKSSTRRGSSILFGKKGIFTGVAKLGDAAIKDALNTPSNKNQSSEGDEGEGVVMFIIALLIGLFLMVCCS